MKCCALCFSDKILQKDLIPSLSDEHGRCSYCGTEDVDLVAPQELAELFAPLINIYEHNPDGKLLVELMKEDWSMFDHPNMDIPSAKNLLADVLNNGEIVRQKFSPSPRFASDGLLRWEQLRDELMYTNRYFPDKQLDTDRLEALLAYLHADELPDRWYRARIQQNEQMYPLDQMGAPPNKVTSHGRANPSGIPYLYLGSKEETAVAELRPHTGELASVADFTIAGSARMIDLRNPRQIVSPFALGDEDAIGSMRTDLPFLERLGEELTRPILPLGAAIEYVPSQYVCEFIKKCGYDGVVYRSSVSDGINIALFAPARAVPGQVKQVRVTRVTVAIE